MIPGEAAAFQEGDEFGFSLVRICLDELRGSEAIGCLGELGEVLLT